MEITENLRLLGLSKKEEKVLLGLQKGADTPLALMRLTKVSRPAVYAILGNLKKRGLVVSRITNGRKSWGLSDERKIDEVLYDAKRVLLKIPEGREEIHGRADSAVMIHRGAVAIKKLMHHIFAEHKHERLHGLQGNVSAINWNEVFSTVETNQLNRNIKKNAIITEGVLPEGWFEEQTELLGVEWAKDFEGRTARINVIDPKYFKHGGQMWVFKKSLYLMALGEEIIIEIRNSEIQKMVLAIFEFMQDNSRVIDANALLRELIGKHSKDNKSSTDE